MFSKKSFNKTELNTNISNLLKSFDIFNHELESQLIIAYSAREESYKDVFFEQINFQILEKTINFRVNGMPLSKITNQKGFWKNIFITNEHTLE